MDFEAALQPSEYIDSDSPSVISFAETVVGDETDPIKKAVKLYYAVRDDIRYDPYRICFSQEGLKASTTLANGYGYCVAKAVLLAAASRAVGIPCRLGFADVKNHLSSEKLKEMMQTDVFAWHGYTELYIDTRWVKATPAFNQSLCDKTGVKPLEFDGIQDSVLHAFDQAGNRHMEYLKEHGVFDDLPFQQILADFKKYYPAFKGLFGSSAAVTVEGRFEDEASAG